MNFGSTFVRGDQVLWTAGLCHAHNEARPRWVHLHDGPHGAPAGLHLLEARDQ